MPGVSLDTSDNMFGKPSASPQPESYYSESKQERWTRFATLIICQRLLYWTLAYQCIRETLEEPFRKSIVWSEGGNLLNGYHLWYDIYHPSYERTQYVTLYVKITLYDIMRRIYCIVWIMDKRVIIVFHPTQNKHN